MSKLSRLLGASLLPLALIACNNSGAPSGETRESLSLDVEKYTLDNGLDVVLHVDRSDPVVAINLAAHVGSARETAGRTGFAHLFEHLLFLDSENLGYGGLDEMNTRIGGEGTNGFTTHDMTQYFQAVPKDALEKVVWAEADKLGWFINTVSQNVVDNEKQVVKNEKRQRVDNAPYGHNLYIVNKTLYPEDHPYNWQVIGSLADLDAATLQDTRDFYSRWYVPNNVTVTLTGDFEVAEAKTLIEKYFGEIPRGEAIEPYAKRPSNLTESVSLMYEDNFATVPQLTMIWPTVEQYHPDSAALDMLVEYLTEGKRAPLNEVLIDELKLTSSVDGFHYTKEIAGEFYVFISPNSGEDIDGLTAGIESGLERFRQNGISQEDLDRIKAGIEVAFYEEFESALGKAIALAEYNLFTDNPNAYKDEIARIQSVTPDDVMRVFNKYIDDKPVLLTSIVPKGAPELALEGSKQAEIVEEQIVEGEGAAVEFDPAARVIDNPTPSAFDRTIEPGFGPAYNLPAPNIWRTKLANGMTVTAKPAVPAMTADMLQNGTLSKTTAELEDAIKSLGSTVWVTSNDSGSYIYGTSLSRNFEKTMALVEDMILNPRWDEAEFETLKRKRINEIIQNEGDPSSISARENAKLKYPEDHMFHYVGYGTVEKLETVTLDDLKAFHGTYFKPGTARLRVAGDIDAKGVKAAMTGLAQNWTGDGLPPLTLPPVNPVNDAKIYFYDVPGAKQSVLRFEHPSVTVLDPAYPLLNAINFPLGGIYTSKLNTELRVNKGYTYGIRSGFSGNDDRGRFSVRSSVRSNVTKESMEIIRDIVGNYGENFTQEELDIMKDALLRGQALKTETLDDKLRMVSEISTYGYPDDYKARNAEAVKQMDLAGFKALAAEHIRPGAMNYLVVGDAATQLERLKELGLGDPVLLNPAQ